MKKIIGLLLVMCMMVMPVSAYNDVSNDSNVFEAVTVLSNLDILNGFEDGSFKPNQTITRAEMAKVICLALDCSNVSSAATPFDDVSPKHWANTYINTAYDLGIINGYGDGNFGPEDPVTYEQAVKMLVSALGYEKKAQSLGGYPTGYMMVANQEGITSGTTNTGAANRGTVAKLTYNALTVPMMDQTSWGTNEQFNAIPTQSLLWSKLDAVKAEVVIDTIPLNKDAEIVGLSMTSKNVDKVARANNFKDLEEDSTTIIPVKINGVDLTGLQGLKITVILDKSDIDDIKLLGVVSKAGKNVEVTIDPDMLVNANNGGYVEYYKTNDDDKVSKLKLEGTPATYVNLETGSYAADVAVGGNVGDVAYRYVDTDKNGSYDTVFVDNEKVFVVSNVNTTSNKIFRSTESNTLTTFTGASLLLDPENDNLAWSIKDTKGNVMNIADIKAGDVVAVKTSNVGSDTYYDITVSNKTVTGTITETFTETAKVGGTTLNKFKIGDADYMMLDNSAMTPGDKITAKVYGDKVVAYSVKAGVQNFGMVIAANRAEDFGATYQLQVLTQKGKLVTLNFAEKVNGTIPSYASTAALTAAYPVGDVIAYELNKAGEIKAIDVETSYIAASAKVLDTTDKIATDVTSQYKESSEKLGSYYITENTIFYATETDRTSITKENVAMASKDILAEDTNYTYSVVYNSNKEAVVVVLINVANQIDYTTYPIAITKTATVTVDGDIRTKLFGYVNGEETEIIIAEDADASATGLTVGDIALFTTNAAGEMVKAYTLADKSGTNFIVKANYAEDDEDGDVAGNLVTLSTTNTAADTCMTVGAAETLKGFGAAGKAYRIQGNLLRLVKAADYASTFAGTLRDYTNLVDEDLIQDYSVNANAVAYLYDTATGKYTVTTLLDAETDYTTADYQHGDQIDNDDLVYVYNYDGETKLVLIVDVNSDN